MGVQKKIALWSLGVLSLIAAFFLSVLVLAPLYLNSLSTKEKIETAISRQLGGSVRYQRLTIALWPLPHVIFHEARLSIPKTASGTLKIISIYPQLFPLMKGDLLFSRILVREPDLSIALPETVQAVQPEALSLPEVKRNVLLLLKYLTAIGPGLVVEMDRGAIKLTRKGHLLLFLQDAAVRFNAPPGIVAITLRAHAEPWGAFSMSGKYSFNDDKAEVKDLALTAGRSALSGFSAGLSWKDAPRLNVVSGRATFALAELYQWLSSSGTLTAYVNDVRSLSGEVTLASVQADVPLYRLADSKMAIAGEAGNVVLDWGPLPAPLSVTGQFIVEENRLMVSDFSAHLGHSALSRISASLSDRKNPVIGVKSGQAVINLGEVFLWGKRIGPIRDMLNKVKNLAGIVRLSSLHFSGPLFSPRTWKRALSGSLEHVALASPLLPGPFVASRGDFSLAQDALAFTKVRASLLDTRVTGSGAFQGAPPGMRSLDLDLSGKAGQQSMEWVFDRFALPPEFMVNAPVAFSDTHVAWREASGASFLGTIAMANGPILSLDLSRTPQELAIRRAAIKDRGTSANITLRRNDTLTDISFSGRLAQTTLSRIFKRGTFGKGTMQGDLHVAVRTDRPADSTAQGRLVGKDLVIPWGLAVPVRVDNLSLHADRNILTVDSAALTWGKDHYTIHGDVSASDAGLVLDMDLGADTIAVDTIQQALARTNKKSAGQQPRPSRMPPLLGVVNAHAASLAFGRFIFSPARAVVSLSPHQVNLAFTEAKTCGLSLSGTLGFSGEDIHFDFKPQAAKQPLEPTMDCLAGQDIHVTGTFDLNADILAQGKSGALLPSLEGTIDFASKDGKIYRYPVLAKIFSVLSVLEIFRGKLPELGGNGFPYHTMVVKGRLHQGKFLLEKAYIGGSSLDLIAEGEIDLAARKLDLVVLVSPFSTINWIIRHIPLVGKIMGGTLISVPTKVAGDLDNPDVTFLAPSAVGTRLLDLLKNILKIPVEIISPILPKEKEKKE